MNNFTVRQQQEPGCPARFTSQVSWVISVLAVPSPSPGCHPTDPEQNSGSKVVKTAFSSRGGDGLMDEGGEESRERENSKLIRRIRSLLSSNRDYCEDGCSGMRRVVITLKTIQKICKFVRY